MRNILTQLKRFIAQFEAISPNTYDGLVMQMMGGF